MISITDQNITYPIALLLSSSPKKNFESLAKDIGISGDSVARILEKSITSVHELVAIAKSIFKKKRIYLLIDDTLIDKIYSRAIEGACDNFSSSDRKIKRSLCTVVAMLTDGEIAIPIDQTLWISAEMSPTNHPKKWELAQALIFKIRQLITIKMVVMDGLYAVRSLIRSLIESNINFEMRFHSNRVITCKDKTTQVKNCPYFKISGKRPKRTLLITWKNMNLYVTAFRRRMSNGEFSIVYQISNYKASAREHVQAYGYRWNIEKFFRTAKQKLGLNDCLARKKDKQEKHIMNVFLAYAFAQLERIKLKCENVETALKSINRKDFKQILFRFKLAGEIFGHI